MPGQYGDDTITGAVVNNNKTPVTGPISTTAYCFDPSGNLLSVQTGFVSGNGGLAPGQTGGYSDTLYNQTCPTYLVGSSQVRPGVEIRARRHWQTTKPTRYA